MTENIECIENESSEDEIQSHGDNIQSRRNDIQPQEDESESHGPEFENVSSEEEFNDFSSDDSVRDKNYYPSSSGSDDDLLSENGFDNENEGKPFFVTYVGPHAILF